MSSKIKPRVKVLEYALRKLEDYTEEKRPDLSPEMREAYHWHISQSYVRMLERPEYAAHLSKPKYRHVLTYGRTHNIG
jgi:hypothetical protein